jgi:hypothetical protein
MVIGLTISLWSIMLFNQGNGFDDVEEACVSETSVNCGSARHSTAEDSLLHLYPVWCIRATFSNVLVSFRPPSYDLLLY